MRVTDLLSRDEISGLTEASDAWGWLAVGTDWVVIALCLAAPVFAPHPVVWGLAAIVLGGRQLGLAIGMHEAAHRSLFRTRWLNDAVGGWLCGGPVWADLHGYREHHMRHHGRTGTPDDPDLGLVTPFPTTRASLARKFLRDLTGIAGLRRIAALLAMDLGFITYSASTGQRRALPQERADLRRRGLPSLARTVLSNGVLAAVLTALGHPELYLLWAVSWLIPYGFFLRIRAIAEHAGTELSGDLFRNTRTTRASWLARLLFAPHGVNFHLEHHLLPTVPYWQLPRMHALLAERGGLNDVNTAPGYLAVLGLVTSGKDDPRGV